MTWELTPWKPFEFDRLPIKEGDGSALGFFF